MDFGTGVSKHQNSCFRGVRHNMESAWNSFRFKFSSQLEQWNSDRYQLALCSCINQYIDKS